MSPSPPPESAPPGLRERKKAQTRRAITQAALRLFAEQGYSATTCEQIAAAAEVSTATFYRYFPGKEAVVLDDDYDPMLAELIRARPGDEAPVDAVRAALTQAFASILPTDEGLIRQRAQLIVSVPALQARNREQTAGMERMLAEALAARSGTGTQDLSVRVIAAACAAAVGAAVGDWARHGGSLAGLVDEALAALLVAAGRDPRAAADHHD